MWRKDGRTELRTEEEDGVIGQRQDGSECRWLWDG
jgi:hypothetical protein